MKSLNDGTGNMVLLRGAGLWLLAALLTAWCLVAINIGIPIVSALFKDYYRLLQAHIDFLIMTALIFGIYASRVELPWHVSWTTVIGAFTNSSCFLFMSIFPTLLDPAAENFAPDGMIPVYFKFYLYASLTMSTYGFGLSAIFILILSQKNPNEFCC